MVTYITIIYYNILIIYYYSILQYGNIYYYYILQYIDNILLLYIAVW